MTLGNPYWRADHGCNSPQYNQPHDYFGIWNGGWVYTSVGSANYPGGTYTLPHDGESVIFGLGTGGGIPWIPCWRDLYAGGAHVWLDDNYSPSVYSVTDPPTKWINATDSAKVVAQASDAGLGIRNVVVHSDGSDPRLHVPDEQKQCPGTKRSPCLTSYTATFNFVGADFLEGRRAAYVKAYDATEKSSNPYYFETKVDTSAPEVTLDGQLAKATNEVGSEEKPPGTGDELSLPAYNLKIEAKDGNPSGGEKEWRSGVKDIEVYLDGAEQEVTWSPTSSCSHSCPMTKTYVLKLSKLSTAGAHKLEVWVKDFVGNIRKRELEFEYFPATGIKDEYVMHHFPLPDGQGNEAEEEHPDRPELAVNVMNGNLVYREQDIEVEGTAALDLKVERYYNSQLPTGENTEWGDGWTLAETPDLQPLDTGGSPAPDEAELLDASGAIEEGVELPTEAGAQKFDPALQATLTKKSSGGYELSDETGESAASIAFDETGQTEALLSEGLAKVDYTYEGGDLAEIEVEDPATFAADPEELEIPEPELITKPIFAGAFGSNGSGDGQLKSPSDVAVDSQGSLWVVDKSNNRIQKFDPTGKFLAKFGSSGSGDGQFNRPTAITIASNGNLLVTDAGNGRVQRFSSAGAYISKFGAKGTGNGQFTGSGPEGIAIDAAGSIWVSDTYGGRLQKFNSAGEFIKVAGSKGSGSGQLGEPTGIDVDPSGNVWVADWQNNRVSVFNSNGEFLSQFGSAGSGDGQFTHPDEIEIDKLGSVWVGDQGNNRIQQFDLAAQFKGKFGSAGSGQGQFNFSYPMGIAADSKGHLWIADVNNHRFQEWLVPIEQPAYISTFGSLGSGDGQLMAPGDVAVGVEGNLWVVDKSNNRIQKVDSAGKFLAKFGSSGSGDGQFNRPTAIAVDRDGNLLVTDANNNRVQKFSPEGQFISKFGSAGTGNGQLSSPEGIVTDFDGNIWVSDSLNGRLQQFNEAGEFIKVVSSKGSGSGQLGKPIGIDIDAAGNLWVADWQNNRVSVFNSEGEFLNQFGSLGTGPGQFNRPGTVEIDARGNVWVGDQVNGRVQRFDLAAQYVGQFGAKGSGEGQFSFPTVNSPIGIASDRTGHIWVTDVNNHRIQRWALGNYAPAQTPELDLRDGDPAVEVETPGGLVSSVSGNAAGEHTYVHSGDDLTAHDGPEGETKYEYDAAGRMTKVTLPNGTWAQVAYFSDGRVKSVTVDLAGATPAKKTEFEYQDEPSRRTTVIPPDDPHVTYDIGEDGSVLKWWNTEKPPTIEPLTGDLYTNRGTASPVSTGDYILTARAWSAEGIASIDIIVNGNQVVDEMSCEQDPNKPGLECVNPMPLNQWVTETGAHAPGILNVEVLVTDRIGNSAAERFWVNIPYTPPPSPGAVVPPKHKDIKKFREDYGLEIVFPVQDEIELNERIFNLIGAWHNPSSPAGQVARASWERWGVPLRPEDVAELEYRERYIDHAANVLPQWVTTHGGGYAGYYVDHRQGGLVHVGLTSNHLERVEALKGSGALIAPSDRLRAFPSQPQHTLAALESLQIAASEHSGVSGIVTRAGIDVKGNRISVGATNAQQAQSILLNSYGAQAPITVYADSFNLAPRSRQRYTGPVKAGDLLRSEPIGECTTGYGAWDTAAPNPATGLPVYRHFLLSAGHCFQEGWFAYRWQLTPDGKQLIGKEDLGYFRRSNYKVTGSGFVVDAIAARLNSPFLAPRLIYHTWNQSIRINEPKVPQPGMTVCFSGITSNRTKCGPVMGPPEAFPYRSDGPSMWQVPFEEYSLGGDSGGPVWEAGTGRAIGLLTAGAEPLNPGELPPKESVLTPLLPSAGHPAAPGILAALGTPAGNLHLVRWK